VPAAARCRRGLAWLGALLLLGLLGGCGGQPMAFPTPASEMGAEPGLLSGPQGAFELYPTQKPPAPAH
jgi:hypothetical protein